MLLSIGFEDFATDEPWRVCAWAVRSDDGQGSVLHIECSDRSPGRVDLEHILFTAPCNDVCVQIGFAGQALAAFKLDAEQGLQCIFDV